MFTDKIDPIFSNVVETIGGKDIIPKICKLHTKKLNNVLYFTDSPDNILV